jgi:hypothetical protein
MSYLVIISQEFVQKIAGLGSGEVLVLARHELAPFLLRVAART